jgi:hypothetical protein
MIIPLWIKIVFTLYVAVVVAVYARKYSLSNFLWFSDIALLATVPALWLESSFLASMMAVGVLLPEFLWNAGFFGQLLTGRRLTGLTDYMFDRRIPPYLRALSLFHVFLPVLLLWMVHVLGYSPAAWIAQTFFTWALLPVIYFFTSPEENVNWVFGPGGKPQKAIPPPVYLGLLMIGFPLLVYIPTHFLLLWLFS